MPSGTASWVARNPRIPSPSSKHPRAAHERSAELRELIEEARRPLCRYYTGGGLDLQGIVGIRQSEADCGLAERIHTGRINLEITAGELARLVDEGHTSIVVGDQAVGVGDALEDCRGHA